MDQIVIPGCDPIKRLDVTADKFFQKSTVIYGPSRTGKSVYIRNILYQLKDMVEYAIVVCPTELSTPNPSYLDIIPKLCIHSRMFIPNPDGQKEKPKDGILRFFETILQLQTAKSEAYKLANSVSSMKAILKAAPKTKQREELYDILYDADDKRATLVDHLYQHKIDEAERAAAVANLDEKFTELVKSTIKKYLLANISSIMRELQKHPVKNADLISYLKLINSNPNIILVLDDCASDLKEVSKIPDFIKLFYQGRHFNVTVILTCQDDTDLAANLRKNIFYSIYSSAAIANCAVQRAKVPKKIAQMIEKANEKIYTGTHNTKLVYVRELNTFFFSVSVHPLPKFRIGCDECWKICDKIIMSEKTASEKSTNKFKNLFS